MPHHGEAGAGGLGPYFYIIDAVAGTYTVYDYEGNLVHGPSADANAEIGWAFANLTAGRDWQERVVLLGNFDVDGVSQVFSYTHVSIFGKLTMADGVTDNILEIIGGDGTEVTDVTIEGGELQHNGEAYGIPITNQNGIYAYYVLYLTIRGVKAVDCPSCGFHIRSCLTTVSDPGAALVTENRAETCGKVGFRVNACYHIRVTENESVHNDEDGYFILASGRPILKGNGTWNNVQDGYAIDDCRDCSVGGNISRYQGRYDFHLMASAQDRGGALTGNATEASFNHSIYCVDDGWTITGNSIANPSNGNSNQFDGIHVTGAENLIENNQVTDNRGTRLMRHGICVTGDKNHVGHNEVRGALSDGIHITGGNNNNIQGNDLIVNDGYGIQVDALATENQIQNNYTQGNVTASARINNVNCVRNLFSHNCFDEGAISDVGGAHGCVAYLNYDPSAGAMIATINAPLVVGGGGGALP